MKYIVLIYPKKGVSYEIKEIHFLKLNVLNLMIFQIIPNQYMMSAIL